MWWSCRNIIIGCGEFMGLLDWGSCLHPLKGYGMIRSMKSIINNIPRIRTIAVSALTAILLVDAIVWVIAILAE